MFSGWYENYFRMVGNRKLSKNGVRGDQGRTQGSHIEFPPNGTEPDLFPSGLQSVILAAT
jgi:hypothetical protein